MNTCILPFISGENETLRTRGNSTSGWGMSNSGHGTVTTDGAEVTVAKSSGCPSGTAFWADRTVTVPASKDWLLYMKITAPWTTANDNSAVMLINANNATNLASISCHNNQETNTKVQNTASIVGYTGTTKVPKVVSATDDLGQEQEWRFIYDSKYSCLMCERKEGGVWTFKARIVCDNPSSTTGVTIKLRVQIGGTASNNCSIRFRDLMVCRPNIILFGNSAAACLPGWSPNPNASPAANDPDHRWYQYLDIYPDLWNNAVINKGVGGNGTAALLARLQADILDQKPRLVILQGPGNDRALGLTHAQRQANHQAIIDAITATGCHVVVLNVNYGQETSVGNQPPTDPTIINYFRPYWQNNVPNLTGLAAAIDIMVPIQDANGYLDPQYATSSTDDHLNIAGKQAVAGYVQQQAA